MPKGIRWSAELLVRNVYQGRCHCLPRRGCFAARDLCKCAILASGQRLHLYVINQKGMLSLHKKPRWAVGEMPSRFSRRSIQTRGRAEAGGEVRLRELFQERLFPLLEGGKVVARASILDRLCFTARLNGYVNPRTRPRPDR